MTKGEQKAIDLFKALISKETQEVLDTIKNQDECILDIVNNKIIKS